jgi:1-deoxy-D-xylulose-5-phosphate reductoisomerase
MQSLLVLGSTGSIGTQTLDVVRASAGALAVSGLAAGRAHARLAEQVRDFRPRWVALRDPAAARELAGELLPGTTLFSGEQALAQIAAHCEYDTAVHGIVGAAGLAPSVEVIRRGKKLALANKESLVMAGALLMPLAQRHGASIVPVDSEHSAIHQCLRGERIESVRRVILTASGGPFRQHTQAELERATPAAALQHPNWTMGPRITIGSATLMNKALEVIELAHLFGLDAARIEVAIHPQSIVHSLVEFIDGSVVAQLGLPDMRVPIHYAIHHPERAPSQLPGFDWQRFAKLEFSSPDSARFPALRMGYEALERGGSAGAVLNAADEVAVEAFLAGRIGFLQMAQVQQAALSALELPAETIEDILRADQCAREFAADLILGLEKST